MDQLIYTSKSQTVTLSAAVETDLLPGGSSGIGGKIADPPADVIEVTITETGGVNPINTITIYRAPYAGGVFVADSSTYTVSAGAGATIKLSGFTGDIRITGNSTSGATAKVDIAAYRSGVSKNEQTIVNGVVQGGGVGGTISGNLSQSAGTATINATGAVSIDGTTSIAVGATSATSVAIGRSAVADSHPGGMTVGSGKAITGSGAMAVEAASGSTLTVGGASNAVALGQAGKTTTISGSVAMGGAANASALATFISTTQGVLIPVMTTTQKNAIGSPAEGLVVYDATLHKLCIRVAAAWETITSS
jgi:hypothetical protein